MDTLGPLHVSDRAWAARGVTIELRDGEPGRPPNRLIATVSSATGRQRMPYARLFAAAPNMRAALETLRALAGPECDDVKGTAEWCRDMALALEAADAAIRKANGDAP